MEYVKLLLGNIDTNLFKKLYNEQIKLAKYNFKYFEKVGCIDTATDLLTTVNNTNTDPKDILSVNIQLLVIPAEAGIYIFQ